MTIVVANNTSSKQMIDHLKLKLSKIISVDFGYEYHEIINMETNIQYLAKILMHDINESSIDKLENLSRELDVILKLNYPSILNFIKFNPTDFSNNQRQLILMEFASNGTLNNFFYNTKSKVFKMIGWDRLKQFIVIYGIASAMSYLHSHGIIHCNLTPNSIYLDSDYYPKISGFDFSQKLTDIQSKIHNRFTKLDRNATYLAPEVLLHQEFS